MKSHLLTFGFVSTALLAGAAAGQSYNGLALTPPMGWNSWNKYAGNITDALVRQTGDAMVSSGMAAAGYKYVNIDDCWQLTARSSSGHVQPDPAKFPNGIKAVADYLHSKGLKLGIYSDRGTLTCSGRAGSYGHETTDATDYAAWGVDYLKYDNCSAAPGSDMQTDYTNMKNALVKSGRPIVFSQCAWWFYNWEPTTGNLWRTTTDIKDTWASMLANFDQSEAFSSSAKPGGWNDPDMLEVGNGGMTDVEYRTHMSLWAMAAAPLIAGNDIANMSAATKAILVAPEILVVDQDSLGKQGTVASNANNLEILSKPLVGGNVRAVALFNRGTTTANISVTWNQLGLPAGSYAVRDLWAQKDLGKFSTGYTAMAVASHATVMLGISPPSTAIATLSNAENSSLETRVANHSLQVTFHPSSEVASAVLELCDLRGRLAGRIAMANGPNGDPVTMSVKGIHGGVYYLLAWGNGTILARKTVILPE
jgi:alpha-galactosidase